MLSGISAGVILTLLFFLVCFSSLFFCFSLLFADLVAGLALFKVISSCSCFWSWSCSFFLFFPLLSFPCFSFLFLPFLSFSFSFPFLSCSCFSFLSPPFLCFPCSCSCSCCCFWHVVGSQLFVACCLFLSWFSWCCGCSFCSCHRFVVLALARAFG